MITTILLYIIFGLIKVLLIPFTLLPNASLPVDFSNAIVSASNYISAFNDFIPVNTILIILGLVLTIELFINIFKLINWTIKKIPTIG